MHIKRIAIAAIILPIVVGAVLAQQTATTESGDRVILNTDGTWTYTKEAPAGTARITAILTEFSFEDSSAANNWTNNYRDFFNIVMQFANRSDRNIRAFRATVVFRDLFGEVIWRVTLRQNDPIEVGSTIVWSGRITYNMFNDSHALMKGMQAKDLSIDLEDMKVVWAE